MTNFYPIIRPESKNMLQYPVVVFVYKRPEKTEKLLEIIIKSQPSKVYIFSDGPRNAIEKSLNDRVIDIINKLAVKNKKIKFIKNYSKTNLGLRRRIISGLNQVFRKEKAAIILEDDCHPNPDFFIFCSSMLTKYSKSEKVMSINGSTTGGQYKYSYEFTKYPQCWGWATWGRAWAKYDENLVGFNKDSWKLLSRSLGFSGVLSLYWYGVLRLVKIGWTDTWDYQWSYAHFTSKCLAISPSVNMVSNIGFDSAATNTKTKSSVENMRVGSLKWPLKHPSTVKENATITRTIESYFYQNPIALLGLIRQYIYLFWDSYVNRN